MTSRQNIPSLKDPRIENARALTSAAGRRAAHRCLLEGAQIIEWALAANLPVEHVFCHDRLENHPLFETLAAQNIPVFFVSEGILKKITDTGYLIPLVGVADLTARPPDPPGDFVMVVDEVLDQGNIGTIIRTARGFGIRDVFATRPDFDMYFKKTIEASRGTVFDVQQKKFNSSLETILYLKQHGYQIVATSSYGSTVQATARLQSKPLALVVGNETRGVSQEILEQADFVLQIPMSEQVESLNVGVATGISVYELKLKLVLSMLNQYIRKTLGREVNVAGKLIQRALDAKLKTLSNFNSTQLILLMVLQCDEVMTLKQVSQDTAAFGEELHALLQPLLQDGLIQYSPADPSAVQITATGKQLIGQLWGVVETAENQIMEGFSSQEKSQLMDFLRRVQANCVKMMDENQAGD